MSSESSGLHGRLVVALPHWSASVRVYDNRYQPLDVAVPPATQVGEHYQVSLSLPPGVYGVEVALGTSNDSEWVSVRPGKEAIIPAERWSHLYLPSAAPLRESTSQPSSAWAEYARQAEAWSHTSTWPSPKPGPSRLFVFVHTPDPAMYPEFSRNLTLLDTESRPMIALAGDAVAGDVKAGWVAFTTDLAGGFYILSRKGPGRFIYNQPLYLCDGWETQVFMAGGRGPSFRSLTLHMAPMGHGFRDDEDAAASEAVLAQLRAGAEVSSLLGSSHLQVLLRHEQKNPWLAVLAAYVMVLSVDERRRPTDDTPPPPVDTSLREEVFRFLRQTIPSHPDVRAILLEPNGPAPEPFTVPPLLRVGLGRVQQHATRFASTIPVGTVTDFMLSRQVTSSPWSVWRQPDLAQARKDRPAGTAVPPPAVRHRGKSTEILRSGLGSSAPVFQAPGEASGPATASSELHRALHDLPLLKAARQMIVPSASTAPETIVINVGEEAKKLIDSVDAHAVSAASGIPLARVEQALNHLKQQGPDVTIPVDLPARNRTEQVILEYALSEGARAPSATAAESGVTPAPSPASAPALTLEDCAKAMKDASEALSKTAAAEPSPDPAIAARLRPLASRFETLAKALLRFADGIVITDTSGVFLYGNGAFALLMAFEDPAEPLRASRAWSRWLATLPVGETTGVSAPADSAARRWTVRQTMVEDQHSDMRVFVSVLSDEQRAPLPPETLAHVTAALPDVNLHGSFVQYGSTKRRVKSLEWLETFVVDLERRLEPSAGNAAPP